MVALYKQPLLFIYFKHSLWIYYLNSYCCMSWAVIGQISPLLTLMKGRRTLFWTVFQLSKMFFVFFKVRKQDLCVQKYKSGPLLVFTVVEIGNVIIKQGSYITYWTWDVHLTVKSWQVHGNSFRSFVLFVALWMIDLFI